MTNLIFKLRERISFDLLSTFLLVVGIGVEVLAYFAHVPLLGILGEVLLCIGIFFWGVAWLEGRYEECECEDEEKCMVE